MKERTSSPQQIQRLFEFIEVQRQLHELPVEQLHKSTGISKRIYYALKGATDPT